MSQTNRPDHRPPKKKQQDPSPRDLELLADEGLRATLREDLEFPITIKPKDTGSDGKPHAP